MFRRFAQALFTFALILGATTVCLAQNGNIKGTVADSAGALIAGAAVEATNDSTGEKRSTTTADDGSYSIPNLQVGIYTVTANAAGFAPATTKEVKVSVAFTTDVGLVLAAGGASANVTVTAGDAQTQLNTTDQQLSTLLDNKKIIDLPLLSRDPSALILLSPGTVASSGIGGFIVNGQRERNNNFMVDGIDNNDADVPGIPGGIATPNIDATQEFRVITGNFNAEYGRNTGAIIAVATKNGTNDFHGNGYIYYRSDRFNARNFFDVSGAANPQQRKQFGASIGGPIVRDKAFFFFNYEGDRFDQGFTVTRTVPTARARLGLFDLGGTIGTLDARGAGINNAFGFPVRSQQTALLNALYPLPNRPGQGSVPGVFEQFVFGSQTNDKSNSIATRLDYRINDKHNLTGSFNYNNGNFEFCCESFPTIDDSIKSPQKTYLLALNFVSNITPNLVNEARVGGNRSELFFNGEGDPGVGTRNVDAIRAAFVAQGASFPTTGFGGPNGSAIGFVTSGPLSIFPFDTQFRFTGTTMFADSLNWIRGDHNFKFGFEHRRVYTNGASNFGRAENLNFNLPGIFGFPLLVDAGGNDLSLAGSLGTVQNFASFLYGLVGQQSQSQYFNKDGGRTEADYRGYRVREFDLFFQDTWRVRPNFTLNYGMRYEIKGVPFEVNGQMSTLVDQDPSGFTPPGGFVFKLVGKNSANPNLKLYDNDFNNFAPRFGFNWSPGWDSGFISKLTGGPGKMAVRGGYGIFYDRVFGNLFSNSSANPPFQRDFANFPGDFIEFIGRPPTQVPSPIARGFFRDTAFNGDFLFPVIFALKGNNQFQSKFANPITQAWNFGFQRQFGNEMLIEADYVGNKGNNQLRVIDGNLTNVTRVNAIRAGIDAPRTISPTNLTNNFLNGSLNSAFFQSALNLSVGQSSYHSGQFRITKRLTNKSFGLGQLQAAYTWSHSIDDSTDPLVGQAGERTFPRDSSGFAGGWQSERGNSGFDTRHRFVANYIYEFPLYFENKALDLILGHWSMGGIFQVQSGNPYSIFGGTDSVGSAFGQRADYANAGAPVGTFSRLAAPTNVNQRTQTGPTADLFRNPCAGVVSATGASCTNQLIGRQGNVARGAFVGPGFNKFDFNLVKQIPLDRFREGMRFTMRADFFNLFNRVNFGQPVNAINAGNFGQSTAAGAGRIVQFVGRFEY
ncbi:MAG: TonB-dependent receptor [Acidobacteriota bacterium]